MEQVPEAFFRVHEGVCSRKPNFEPQVGQHFIRQNWWAWSCWKVCGSFCQNIYGLLFAILHYKKLRPVNKNLSKVHFFHILSAHAKGLNPNLSTRFVFNPITTNGHIVPPPPTARYTSPNIARTPWATELKLSDNLNDLVSKTQIFTKATSKFDACFWTTHFGSFPAKAPTNSKFFFANFHDHYLI